MKSDTIFTGALRNFAVLYPRWLAYRARMWWHGQTPMRFFAWAHMKTRDAERRAEYARRGGRKR